MARIEPNWSTLPEELLFSIVKLLPTRIDILRWRAVCRSFRATIPHPPIQYPFPHSILTSNDFLKGPNPKENDVFTLMVSTVYAIEPLNKVSNIQGEETPQTWVVRVQEPNPGRVVIIDPISGSKCKDLSDQLPKSLNLLDYRVTEITKSYILVSTGGKLIVTKLIFSSFLDENDVEFAVMTRDNCTKELGIWRNVDKKWSKIDMELGFLGFLEFVEDVIYYNRKFYAVLSKGRTVTVDSKSLVVTRVAEELQFVSIYSELYLMELYNDLFLIVQFREFGDDFDEYIIMLFKLNEENQKWVPVVDGLELEYRVLFMGKSSFAFSFSIEEVAGCVYYAGASLLGRNREESAEMIVRKHGGHLRISWNGEMNAANGAEMVK
ncbi:F-box/kelch-repeat protein At1g64840-like [Pistacia vera]|uniref:F-box/kelch-repeat protein At1g64840-like n=1 Tax=Pistacia vera TaxID=55513 RepID=UPI00126377C4|nr:F-box/kelch-repeat protein At1g64840-like [Pistacia vera]